MKIQGIIGLSFCLSLVGCGGSDMLHQPNTIAPATGATQNPIVYPQISAPPSTTEPTTIQMNDYRENFFKNYGVNPFVETLTDPLSTFSADVDTASYSISRAYLNQGQLPPVAAVRTEEFVNSFVYHYPTPTDGQNFAIHTDLMTSPFDKENAHILRVGIQAREVTDTARKKARLTFVIDVSGSMNKENRLELAKRSLQLLLNKLDPTDEIALVIYGSKARTVLKHTPIASKATIENAINNLRPEGATNAEAGLLAAYSEATRGYKHGDINRVILCSDGVANVGETGPKAILDRIKAESDNGIQLTTLGFGMNGFNDTLMEQLANQGDGNYAYIDTIEQAEKTLSKDLTSTLQMIAKDLKIQVDFAPEYVSQYRLLGYENRNVADNDFRNDAVDAGEVGAGHSVTALYEVRFTEQGITQLQESPETSLATVKLRYKDIDNFSIIQEIKRETTGRLLNQSPSQSLQLSTYVATFAEILRDSVFARNESLSKVYQNMSELTDHETQSQELMHMIKQAESIKDPGHKTNTRVIEESENPHQLDQWQNFLIQQLGGS